MADSTEQPAASATACQCESAPKLIFACSGAADVGCIADLAARQLAKLGVGKMFCLAGIGGRVSGIMASTEAASAVLVIDGCGLDCAKKTLESAGFQKFAYLRLSDLGMEKGRTLLAEQSISRVVEAAKVLLAQPAGAG
jgi:uncharacterized metal-binding protein